MARRAALRALAARLGVLDAYRPMVDAPPRRTSDATREALLAAMGMDATSERGARRALERLEAEQRRAWLPPVRVLVRGERAAERIPLGPEAGLAKDSEWRIELREESGRTRVREGRGRLLRLPGVPETGYHELRVELGSGAAARQRLIVAPRSCWRVEESVGGRARRFGLVANLYTLRSRRDWGVGDLGHLRALVGEAGRAGAAFVGLSPLHAIRARGLEVSPYSPLSRLHRAEIHLEIEAVPEWRGADELRRRVGGRAFGARLRAARERSHVDYDAVSKLKREVLTSLHARFLRSHGDGATARGRAYARFLAAQPDVVDFATFVALVEHFEQSGRGGDWRTWPASYRDPGSASVRDFRAVHARQVGFHGWVQFELDRQLGAVARRARRAGLALGLYQDLAVGAAPSGYEAWSSPGLYARANVGAPPDDFSATGQDWGLPALDPRVLVEGRFEAWVQLLRVAFSHSGALRIDHVMGLSRRWWLPEGWGREQGGYVRYPARELFAILALESRRHRALVVGEDLGTVPPGFTTSLARWGILSTRVLLFERDGARFRPASRYSRRALVTPTTHDLPPMAGFLSGRDLELRRSVGALAGAGAVEAARDERRRLASGLRRRLGVEEAAPYEAVAAGWARFLGRTQCPLVGLPLDDLVGETEPVNLPGVPPDQHPSWTRRMSVPVEALGRQPAWGSALRGLARARGGRGTTM